VAAAHASALDQPIAASDRASASTQDQVAGVRDDDRDGELGSQHSQHPNL